MIEQQMWLKDVDVVVDFTPTVDNIDSLPGIETDKSRFVILSPGIELIVLGETYFFPVSHDLRIIQNNLDESLAITKRLLT